MYSYGYGQNYSSKSKHSEPDYMDLKDPIFNLRNFKSNHDVDSDDERTVTFTKKLSRFEKKQANDTTIQDEQELAEAPLLHSEAQNLQIRGQGYESSLETTTTAQSTDGLGTDKPGTKKAVHYEELAAQLMDQYDFRVCADCKIPSKYVCIECHDAFCAVCYASNHRRGRRLVHQRISLELYLAQRSNNVPHERIPDEIPPLIQPDENVKSKAKPLVMNVDDGDYIDPWAETTHSSSSIFTSLTNLTSSLTSAFFGRNQKPQPTFDTNPVFVSHSQMTNDSDDDGDDENAGSNSNPQERDPLPYRTLNDDPSTLDGWWRGTPRHWIRGRAKFIPLRLTHEERYMLRLLISVLTSCDYQGKVDNPSNNAGAQTTNIKKRNVNMITGCMAVLTALIAAKSITAAMEQNIKKYKAYLERVLELGVRHFLRNQKQTGWISVLLCLLQDLQSPQVVEMLGCKITITIRTVHSILYPRNMLHVLDSNWMYLSTEPICVDTKSDLAKRISQRKSKAIQSIKSKFANQQSDWQSVHIGQISEQNLLLCLYSIGDHNLNLHFTRDVCTRIGRILCGLYRWDHNYHIGVHNCVDNAIIAAKDNATYDQIAKAITVDLESLIRLKDGEEVPLLQEDPSKYTQEYDTSTVYNNDIEYMVAQCLNTSNKAYAAADEYKTTLHASPMFRTHTQHLQHVLQTVSLWETLTHYLPFISYLSVVSFLDVDSNKYTLCNNGQGIVRVQPAMLLQRVMVALVVCALRGVGSQAVHIGDSAVPNSLALIDKYLQLNTILTPLLSTARYWWNTTVNQANAEAVRSYRLATFTSKCIQFGHRKLLQHWSVHGMDGSGGDTVFTSGSCADGRLTSVWNWCNLLPNQSFYPLFLLAGFTTFDQVQWD